MFIDQLEWMSKSDIQNMNITQIKKSVIWIKNTLYLKEKHYSDKKHIIENVLFK